MVALDTYAPFDSGAGANVTEDTWRKFARRWLATGVIAGEGNELECYGDSSGLQAKVKTGQAWLPGHWGEVTSEKTVPISANASGNPRIDRVVVRADFVANTVSIEVVEGTPAGSPSAPSLTQSATRWEVSLAQVAVADAAATIAAGNVTDERGFVLEDGALRFGSTAIRDLSVPAPTEGLMCWVVGTYDLRQRYTGAAWETILARGAGTPEANVAAGVGAIYERTDGGTGTTLYIKESGTGNTGWVAVTADSGPALVRTFADPTDATSASAWPAANRAVYSRVVRGGTITKIGFYVATSSGNISVAVCRGSAGRNNPTSRVQTSGAIACPALGAAEVAITSTAVDGGTDWLAMSVDNTTAVIQGKTGGGVTTTFAAGYNAFEATAHPIPVSPSPTSAMSQHTPALIGIP